MTAAHRCIAAALKKGTVVHLPREDGLDWRQATITAVHNADPVPGRIRWETAELGDVAIGGAATVDVVSFPPRGGRR